MKNSLISWTIAHFAVDMSCFYILYHGVEKLYVAVSWTHWQDVLGWAFLLYNVLAFGLQIVLGALSDRWPRLEKIFGIEGLDLMLIPLIIIWISQGIFASWTGMIIAALLNAAFHVGGGVNVLRTSAGKVAPSGIFVSSGALGVIAGTIYGNTGSGAILPVFIVLVCIVMVYLTTENWARDRVLFYKRGRKGEKFPSPVTDYIHFNMARNGSVTVVLCLFFAVIIRSFAGAIWPMGFEKVGILILLPAVSSCLGKALGGILADRVGAQETALASLVVSAFLMMVGNGSWLIIGLSVMFFNMTMPITLCGLVSAMPYNVGFAFGLSTLALLIGYVIYVSGIFGALDPMYTAALLGVLTAVLIYASIKGSAKYKGRKRR